MSSSDSESSDSYFNSVADRSVTISLPHSNDSDDEMVSNAELAQQVTQLQAAVDALHQAQVPANAVGPTAAAQAPVAACCFLDPQKGLLGMLPPFDGMPGSDYCTWVTNFDNVATAMKLTDDEKMTLIPILLTDQVQDSYLSLTAVQKANFDTLKCMLADKFVTQTHLTNALFQLYN